MRQSLMVNPTHAGMKLWLNAFIHHNQANVERVEYKSATVHMRNGDQYIFRVLGSNLRAYGVDAVHFDDRCAGRLTDEQQGLLDQLPMLVRVR